MSSKKEHKRMEKMSVKVAMSKMKKSFQKAIDELNYDNLAATNKAIGECYLELGGNLFADLVLKKQSENPEKSDLYAALVALMGYESRFAAVLIIRQVISGIIDSFKCKIEKSCKSNTLFLGHILNHHFLRQFDTAKIVLDFLGMVTLNKNKLSVELVVLLIKTCGHRIDHLSREGIKAALCALLKELDVDASVKKEMESAIDEGIKNIPFEKPFFNIPGLQMIPPGRFNSYSIEFLKYEKLEEVTQTNGEDYFRARQEYAREIGRMSDAERTEAILEKLQNIQFGPASVQPAAIGSAEADANRFSYYNQHLAIGIAEGRAKKVMVDAMNGKNQIRKMYETPVDLDRLREEGFDVSISSDESDSKEDDDDEENDQQNE